MTRHCSIIPALRYRDAAAAIDFLCGAFGFGRHLVVPGSEGRIDHAQLTLGNAMVMLSSIVDSPYGPLVRQPDVAGGVTQSPYIIVADADAHHERARAAGAKILLELVDQDYGGRGYTCADPEGHVWNFGTYDPWAAPTD